MMVPTKSGLSFDSWKLMRLSVGQNGTMKLGPKHPLLLDHCGCFYCRNETPLARRSKTSGLVVWQLALVERSRKCRRLIPGSVFCYSRSQKWFFQRLMQPHPCQFKTSPGRPSGINTSWNDTCACVHAKCVNCVPVSLANFSYSLVTFRQCQLTDMSWF